MSIRKFLFRSAMKADMFLAASSILRQSSGKSETVFFPGCSLMGYNPEYVFAVRDYLIGNLGSCGIFTACCAKPLKLMGESKLFTKRIDSVRRKLDAMNARTVITACQTCNNLLRQYDTGREILSLWPLIQSHGLPERLRGKFSGLDASIQDSCTSLPEVSESVRKILAFLGVNVIEFPLKKCCGGVQTLTTCDSRYGRKCKIERANESPCDIIISYCASCRSAMSLGGHDSIHILDLIFGEGEPSAKHSNLYNRYITARRVKHDTI